MHRLIKTAVFVLVLIAALFLCEYILRNVVGIVPGTERMVTYQFDDTLGWKSRADYKYYRSSLYYGHFNYYDPQGFPTDVMRWHEAASSSASSVAILGSSHAESYYLPYEQSFPYLIEKKTGKVLGATILGERAGEIIHELALAIELKANINDLTQMIHAFPTFSEAVSGLE